MTTLLEETIDNKLQTRVCPECGGKRLIVHIEERLKVCTDCGFVISAETIGRSPEKSKACRNRRTVQARTFAKTLFAVKDGNSAQENLINTLENWNRVEIENSAEKNLVKALQYITEIGIELSLTKDAVEKAALVYKGILEKGLLKGRQMKAIAAVAVFLGCKQCETATTINDIANSAKISPKKLGRSFRSVMKHLDFSVKPTKADNHATEISERLGMSVLAKKTVEKTVALMDNHKQFAGKSPVGVAAAITYISSLIIGDRKTQREIAEKSRITETTVRSRCREIERSFVFVVYL